MFEALSPDLIRRRLTPLSPAALIEDIAQVPVGTGTC